MTKVMGSVHGPAATREVGPSAAPFAYGSPTEGGGFVATRIVVCDDHPMFRRGLAIALGDENDIVLVGEAEVLGRFD